MGNYYYYYYYRAHNRNCACIPCEMRTYILHILAQLHNRYRLAK